MRRRRRRRRKFSYHWDFTDDQSLPWIVSKYVSKV